MQKVDVMFWKVGTTPYFCSPFTEALLGLPDSIMVVRQILVLFVLVRIQVGQQETHQPC